MEEPQLKIDLPISDWIEIIGQVKDTPLARSRMLLSATAPINDWNELLGQIGLGPYIKMAPIILKINQQAQQQQAESPEASQPTASLPSAPANGPDRKAIQRERPTPAN